jgi:hypothetical protein
MCAYEGFMTPERYRDLVRGRLKEPIRFYRIEKYAKARWERSRKPKHYTQWQKLLTAVKRRRAN